MDSSDQSHPLYASDRETVSRLLAASDPSDADLIDAARLLMRYQGFPGAHDLQDDLSKALRLWGLSREQLHQRTRAVWTAGYRPNAASSDGVGSGFDTTDDNNG